MIACQRCCGSGGRRVCTSSAEGLPASPPCQPPDFPMEVPTSPPLLPPHPSQRQAHSWPLAWGRAYAPCALESVATVWLRDHPGRWHRTPGWPVSCQSACRGGRSGAGPRFPRPSVAVVLLALPAPRIALAAKPRRPATADALERRTSLPHLGGRKILGPLPHAGTGPACPAPSARPPPVSARGVWRPCGARQLPALPPRLPHRLRRAGACRQPGLRGAGALLPREQEQAPA